MTKGADKKVLMEVDIEDMDKSKKTPKKAQRKVKVMSTDDEENVIESEEELEVPKAPKKAMKELSLHDEDDKPKKTLAKAVAKKLPMTDEESGEEAEKTEKKPIEKKAVPKKKAVKSDEEAEKAEKKPVEKKKAAPKKKAVKEESEEEEETEKKSSKKKAAKKGEKGEEKRTRAPSMYNIKIGEFMKHIAAERPEVERKNLMAEAQVMYRAWKAEQPV